MPPSAASEEHSDMPRYVSVYLLDAVLHLDIPYTYYIPVDLTGEIQPGALVVVPFGNGNRKQIAIAVELSDHCAYKTAKPVLSVLPESLRFDEEQLMLCAFMREHTFCTFGDAVRAILPTGAVSKLEEHYETAGDEAAFLAKYADYAQAVDLYRALQAKRNGADEKTMSSLLDGGIPRRDKLLCALIRDGFVLRRTVLRDGGHAKVQTLITLCIEETEAALLAAGDAAVRKKYSFRGKSEAYARLLNALSDGAPHEALALLGDCEAATTQLTLLQKAGIISVSKERVDRNPYEKYQAGTVHENHLSDEQQEAFETLSELCASETARAALLYGVTGSGKTNVMKALIDQVIEAGKQVILLLPEIALTPQSVSIFCAYYKERVAVLHSALSAGEKLDAWDKIRRGEIDLVIGTRSAVFAPFTRLGMIILDEEQEHTYKSDQNPKYHARDIARYRCAKNNAFLLLASATPSFESFYKAEQGKYKLVRLTKRYGDAKLPEVRFADLRKDEASGGMNAVGAELKEQLARSLSAQEQAILFINRRGYHHYMSCMSCGEAVMCPHCSVSLTCHLFGKQPDTPEQPRHGVLLCHYCGYRSALPEECPSCGSAHLKYVGFGTQRTEEELTEILPDARVLRMDADTTQTKFAHAKILDSFRAHEADILLGTQMVTKGHDFPDVTLVGVLSADGMLYQDDYRASEKTFSLLTQVIGRAGRAEKPGLALIQTYNPDHETLKLAAKQDYETFYHGAIGMRKTFMFPPFCDIALLTFSSAEEKEVSRVAGAVRRRLDAETAENGAYQDVPLSIFGPFEATIYRVNERFRQRMVIKCKDNKRTRALFRALLIDVSRDVAGRVSVGIDLNPTSL